MKSYSTNPFGALIFLFIASLACGLAPSTTTRPVTQQATHDIATLPPPLKNVQFPTQVIAYPTNWPIDLRYPEQFSVVEVSSGTLPYSTLVGWAVKLRYAGDLKSAALILSSFFTQKGWQIVESTDLDSGGVLLMIERGDKSTGIVIMDIDASNPAYTIILATVFP